MKLQDRRLHGLRWRPAWVGALGKPAEHARTRPSRRRRMVVALVVVVVAVGVGWLVVGQFRRPTETVYTPAVDAYVSTAHPNVNYGTAPTLRVDATPKIRSYLRFRVDGLSGRVVRAELRLWSPTGDLVGYRVHPVAGTSWGEQSITSKNGPAAGEPVAKSGPFGPGSWGSADVTRLVQANDEVSLALTTRSLQNVTFDSREGSHKPQLVVQSKPAPAPPAATPLQAVAEVDDRERRRSDRHPLRDSE